MNQPRYGRALIVIQILLAAAALAAAPIAARTQGKPAAQEHWASPREYIAGTERSRLKAARSLGLARGRRIIAYLSMGCSDCVAVVPALNTLAASSKVVGVAIATPVEIEQWRKRHGANFPIRPVSENTFEELGAVVLPTIVLFENGKATGARAPSLEEGK